jgi:rubrerythrin
VTNEQDKTLAALKIALQMEVDGKECYLGESRQSGNEVGRRLLQSLAEEEDIHQQRLLEIYEAIRNKKAWPVVALQPDRGSQLRDVFFTTCELTGMNLSAGTADFGIIETAVKREKESYDFYNRQSAQATYDAEREFYRAVAAEEREHELILLDYHEYLTNPAGWFVKKEHHSLDGG